MPVDVGELEWSGGGWESRESKTRWALVSAGRITTALLCRMAYSFSFCSLASLALSTRLKERQATMVLDKEAINGKRH